MTKLVRILHVEDDPAIQQVAKIALEAVGGFEVSSCRGGQQALEQFSDFQPQLVLLDVMMPGMDGPETLRQLQQRFDLSGIPVVFMTAKVQNHEVQSYKELGAADVVVKPFDPMTLSDRIRQIWQQSLLPDHD
ncbi:response regulator [Alkalimonas amylolytica]|uniref:Response regulator receiver domain-containing protein n=1 Tax=Alkalimonas amylolytica TaxID=152573 RepID=A0A1H4D8Q8_ALKAM|nr:response regulator [Alkalimonas amylolytica]SEA69081.1 Response regulator receiver domain-containing protein [Alkalimonas amylolytica]